MNCQHKPDFAGVAKMTASGLNKPSYMLCLCIGRFIILTSTSDAKSLASADQSVLAA